MAVLVLVALVVGRDAAGVVELVVAAGELSGVTVGSSWEGGGGKETVKSLLYFDYTLNLGRN